MGIQFLPQYEFPTLLDTTGPHVMQRESRWPSGWWILPSMIVGVIECAAIIGWIVA